MEKNVNYRFFYKGKWFESIVNVFKYVRYGGMVFIRIFFKNLVKNEI